MKQGMEDICSVYDGLRLSVLWTEPEGEKKGVLQLSHGMCENKERYLPFMEFLANHGYASVIHDHRGHGKSVRIPQDLGFFYGSGKEGIVEDLHQVSLWSKEKFPRVPLFLLGHSMGTLVARNYLKVYDYELEKLILTGPPSQNPAVGAGLLVARIEKKLRGEKYRSSLIQALAFGPYVRKFREEGRISAWICSDPDIVDAYEKSELCGFTFSTDGFESLFLLLKGTYSKKGWKMQKKELPILFLGGAEDPCIGGKKKFEREIAFIQEVGYCKSEGKEYPKMRHEILNEKGKEHVYEDILSFLEK